MFGLGITELLICGVLIIAPVVLVFVLISIIKKKQGAGEDQEPEDL